MSNDDTGAGKREGIRVTVRPEDVLNVNDPVRYQSNKLPVKRPVPHPGVILNLREDKLRGHNKVPETIPLHAHLDVRPVEVESHGRNLRYQIVYSELEVMNIFPRNESGDAGLTIDFGMAPYQGGWPSVGVKNPTEALTAAMDSGGLSVTCDEGSGHPARLTAGNDGFTIEALTASGLKGMYRPPNSAPVYSVKFNPEQTQGRWIIAVYARKWHLLHNSQNSGKGPPNLNEIKEKKEKEKLADRWKGVIAGIKLQEMVTKKIENGLEKLANAAPELQPIVAGAELEVVRTFDDKDAT